MDGPRAGNSSLEDFNGSRLQGALTWLPDVTLTPEFFG
jgi:hypothetical protein